MPKVQLEAAWIYAGERYGPGEADLPEEAHKALGAKGAFPQQEASPAAPVVPPVSGPIVDAVGAKVAATLGEAGYGTVELVTKASDEDLLKVPGLGPAGLASLRALKAGE